MGTADATPSNCCTPALRQPTPLVCNLPALTKADFSTLFVLWHLCDMSLKGKGRMLGVSAGRTVSTPSWFGLPPTFCMWKLTVHQQTGKAADSSWRAGWTMQTASWTATLMAACLLRLPPQSLSRQPHRHASTMACAFPSPGCRPLGEFKRWPGTSEEPPPEKGAATCSASCWTALLPVSARWLPNGC